MRPGPLASVARSVGAAGKAGEPALAELVGHVEKTRLADNAAVTAVRSAEWLALARSLATRLSAEQRDAWAGKLRAAYVTDEATLKTLSVSDVTALSDALSALGDKKAKSVVLAWLATRRGNRGQRTP